jgi:hypothetical protein
MFLPHNLHPVGKIELYYYGIDWLIHAKIVSEKSGTRRTSELVIVVWTAMGMIRIRMQAQTSDIWLHNNFW